ncbi:hypothetical protein AWZ03_001929 [Drosophila navojoa]|uniref:CUB domain-containing protein n=1 Tax=Drosophila navojoa TaxID=7232 RepID=A0A484BRQ0_DRONA|nr:uncharacterized protein LOC108653024 [Drosophila navojoa]TDG51469.1 hypothetical protein AWZ03_001929 [Drosophila navojoa]
MIKCSIWSLFKLTLAIAFYAPDAINGYKIVRLQDNLCSDKLIYTLSKAFRGDPMLRLTDEHDSAAIITQTWNVTLPSGGHSVNKIKYDCQFRVQTNERPPRGIFTIITRLKLRSDPVTKKCIDYIQFSSGNRSPSERICSDISINGPAGRLMFDQRDRDAHVHIFINRDRHILAEPLELHMVLTAHSECQFAGDILCNPKDKYSCISRHFVQDNITNCMYPCRDEGTCFHDAIPPEEMDTTNVALSAITSLIFTMVGVGFCVWICWKYWNCITVQQHAHEASAARFNQRRNRSDVPTIELPTATSYDGVLTQDMSPVSQGRYQQQQQPATPKDLPPSYESLFPDR